MTLWKQQQRLNNRLAILDSLPNTALKIAVNLNLSKSTVRRHMRELYEEGLIYISAYEAATGKGSGQLCIIYSVGPGLDVERPNLSDRSLRRLNSRPARPYSAKSDPLAVMYARNEQVNNSTLTRNS